MDFNDVFVGIAIQYSLAGVVVYLFYKLLSNEVRELRAEIRELRNSIDKLVDIFRE